MCFHICLTLIRVTSCATNDDVTCGKLTSRTHSRGGIRGVRAAELADRMLPGTAKGTKKEGTVLTAGARPTLGVTQPLRRSRHLNNVLKEPPIRVCRRSAAGWGPRHRSSTFFACFLRLLFAGLNCVFSSFCRVVWISFTNDHCAKSLSEIRRQSMTWARVSHACSTVF